MNRDLSLYIHIPLCNSLCDYCDFYSIDINGLKRKGRKVKTQSTQSEYFNIFLDSLIRDIYNQVERFNVSNIPTVYIGGGTPSVLGTDIKVLFDALKFLPAFNSVEFTVEANPESLTEEFLAVCKEGGVTRISLGVQTFHEPSRSSVKRTGDASMIKKSLSLANKYFPGALSVDIITGLPFHTNKIVKEDINKLLDYEVAHVSVYSLTVEKETPLYKKIKTGLLSLSNIDAADTLWLNARDMLIDKGFEHYEVSNFAKKGKQCLHNIRYWRMSGWMGAGPSASGTIIDFEKGTARRLTYKPDVEAYIRQRTGDRGQGSKDQIAISNEQLLKEVLLMGYRYCYGPDPMWGVERYIPKTLEKWKGRGIMLFLNSFLMEAFEELEKAR